MSIDLSPEADQHFYQQGIAYYAAARFAAIAGFPGLTGNLFHHSVEMVIKGRLVESVSMDDLKDRKKYGHNLNSLWTAFKAIYAGDDLTKYDDLVSNLDTFEQIRYPDAIIERGVSITVGFGPSDTFGATTDAFLPCYKLSVTELDELMACLFERCRLDLRHEIGGLSVEARRVLEISNTFLPVFHKENGTV